MHWAIGIILVLLCAFGSAKGLLHLTARLFETWRYSQPTRRSESHPSPATLIRELAALETAFVVERLYRRSNGFFVEDGASPKERGVAFSVPAPSIEVGDILASRDSFQNSSYGSGVYLH